MVRAAACALVAAVLCGSSMAQRGRMGSNSAWSFHSGPGTHIRGSFSRQPFAREHSHRNGAVAFFFPYLFPYNEPYEYEAPYTEVVDKEPAVAQAVVQQPPLEPKVIEIPANVQQTPLKPLPPTVFILNNGERLESKKFLLRAKDLSISIDRRQRTIALDELNFDATVAANRDRGIILEIPEDPNQIYVRF